VHSDLEKCTHVFLRQDATRRALEPPYRGPYKVLSWREKTLQLLMRGRPVTVSADGVKPAYTLLYNFIIIPLYIHSSKIKVL
jgi:cleavage and polyadenylation specificity factor subunit 1